MRSKAEIEAADLGYPQIAALSLLRCQGGTWAVSFPLFPAWRWFCPHRGRQGYSGCGSGPMTDSAPVCWRAEICMRRKRPSSVLPRNVPRSTRCRGWMNCPVRSCASTGAGTAAVLPVRSLRILRKSFLYPAANKKASRLSSREAFFAHISAHEGRSAAEKTSALYRFCAVPVCDFRRDRCCRR